jgi:predicted DNA-binding antitoxin AbrB/MazE fold protein
LNSEFLKRIAMSSTALTCTATFEDGVFRPDQPLPLLAHQRVSLIVQLPAPPDSWPENVADLYREIADEDRRISAAMFSTMSETWPASERPLVLD